MSTTLDYDGLARVLRAGAAKVKANAEHLGQLDSVVGDGDHGVAVTRAMEALEKAIDDCTDKTLQAMMQGVGWAVMSIDAGSTGPLLGSLLMGMSEPLAGADQVDAAMAASMLSAGLAKLGTISKAQVGDKTMVDALGPAAEALQKAADGGASLAEALKSAADAAEAGAEATKQFKAKFGRASNLAERSLGHRDPGASSMALLLGAFAEEAAG
jgi:phosphoenolpyruvate---glycerone phosphotransferase subunit DhaL